MKTLVITGLFSPMGAAIANWSVEAGRRVLGVDIKPMTRPMPGVEFIQADIRNPLFPELLKAEKVDAIFHGAFRWRIRRSEEAFESNVMGAMKLAGAAALAGVKKVIFPSSTFVYGAHIANPYFMTETNDFQGRSYYAYVRELRDIETFLSGFRRQHPEMTITVLRFANVLGGDYPSPLARYLALPLITTLMGYDPLMQTLHFDDAVRAIVQALEEDHQGVYNVAAAPPLPLMKIIRMTGGHTMPVLHPIAYAGQKLTGMFIKKDKALLPIPWDYLRYPWTVSTDKISAEWGFEPQVDAETVVKRFAQELNARRSESALKKTAAQAVSAARRVSVDGFQKAQKMFGQDA